MGTLDGAGRDPYGFVRNNRDAVHGRRSGEPGDLFPNIGDNAGKMLVGAR
jgi:hypothetical protein